MDRSSSIAVYKRSVGTVALVNLSHSEPGLQLLFQ